MLHLFLSSVSFFVLNSVLAFIVNAGDPLGWIVCPKEFVQTFCWVLNFSKMMRFLLQPQNKSLIFLKESCDRTKTVGFLVLKQNDSSFSSSINAIKTHPPTGNDKVPVNIISNVWSPCCFPRIYYVYRVFLNRWWREYFPIFLYHL